MIQHVAYESWVVSELSVYGATCVVVWANSMTSSTAGLAWLPAPTHPHTHTHTHPHTHTRAHLYTTYDLTRRKSMSCEHFRAAIYLHTWRVIVRAVYSIHSTVHYTLYTIHCTVYNVQCTLSTMYNGRRRACMCCPRWWLPL